MNSGSLPQTNKLAPLVKLSENNEGRAKGEEKGGSGEEEYDAPWDEYEETYATDETKESDEDRISGDYESKDEDIPEDIIEEDYSNST